MMEEGYKIGYGACQKEKCNIAQNESNMTIFYEVNLIYQFRKIKKEKIAKNRYK